MCNDKFNAIFIVVESGMIYTYLIVRHTRQTRIVRLAIIEPVILREKVIDAG